MNELGVQTTDFCEVVVMKSGADPGLERRGSSCSHIRPALEERALGGSGGMAPPETFWISDLLRSLLVQSGGEILGRRTCHARTRSSVGDRTEFASYFRSGNFTFCTRPSIITLTAPVAGPLDPRVGQPVFSAVFTMLTAKYQLRPQE